MPQHSSWAYLPVIRLACEVFTRVASYLLKVPQYMASFSACLSTYCTRLFLRASFVRSSSRLLSTVPSTVGAPDSACDRHIPPACLLSTDI
eukprot:3444517-Pleurochrysis_carterae.AAC.1